MNLAHLIFSTLFVNTFADLTNKIVGGQTAKIEDWNFVTFIAFYEESFFTGLCGGSILSAQVVLTAAHCLKDILLVESHEKQPRAIAFMGHANLSSMTVMKNVLGYKTHDKYIVGDTNYDIGLAFLDSPVKFTKTIAKTVLRKLPVETTTNAIAAGWGQTESEHFSMQLRFLAQTVHTQDYCNNALEPLYEGNICAGNKNASKYIFRGDSGGPLVTERDKLQIGLVSWKYVSSTDGLTVYTSIAYFYNWIRFTQQTLYDLHCGNGTVATTKKPNGRFQ